MSEIAPTRVIKLGGSLLELPNLADRLRAWLARQTPARNVIIVGGGRFVDELRAVDRLHGLGDEACHWLAIRAMSLTAHLASALVPEWPLVTTLRDCEHASAPAAILDPLEFFIADESSADPLPHSWAVTSDSIAAQVANRIRAEGNAVELVLVKSSLPREGCDAAQAASVGYVDGFFPRAARGLTACCVDLRDPRCPERRL